MNEKKVDWRYYNHALIPNCAPNEMPDLKQLEDKEIWNQNGKKALFARWITDWDCREETDWWYVIKDTKFDISKLKSKRRYEINKGIKNFKVSIINPIKYKDELYNIQIEAFSTYPKKYRPSIKKEKFEMEIDRWNEYVFFGAFKDNKMCGYAQLKEKNENVDLLVLKVIPKYEKFGINAVIIFNILEHYKEKINTNFYICDGSRSIFHETAFQDYLEKYFEFRKAYCKLHIRYSTIVNIIVKLLYPFRTSIKKINFGFVFKISSVLTMEEIRRKCEK